MCTVKLMIYPEWMVDAMKQNGLSFEHGKDLKILEGIVSVRDLIIYTSINSLHMHTVLETMFTTFNNVRPGLELQDIEDTFMSSSDDAASQLSYRDLSEQVYSPEVLGNGLMSMLCNSNATQVKLVPEVVIGDTIHARIVPTRQTKADTVCHTLEALLQIINDESPIVMEDTALFELYHRVILQNAA
jgi:hypothetical protein